MRTGLLMALLAGCEGGGAGGKIESSSVESLRIEPDEATVETSPDEAGTLQLQAIATYDDGTEAPLEELISWELSNQASGEIGDDGEFVASSENGGITTVTATHNGISATATLTVLYTETLGDGDPADFDGTPVGAINWLYPDDGTTVPRNVPSLTFMWDALPDADGYRLSFRTETTAVDVLGTDNHATVEGDTWASVAATNSGGEVTIEARAIKDGQLYATESRTITVNRLDAAGSIYYWSTTENGIVKVGISDEEAELFYSQRTNSPDCVACHVVRGDRMAVTYGVTGPKFYAGLTDISSGEPVEILSDRKEGYFNTLSPDGTRLITSVTDGTLNYWDAETGEFLANLSPPGGENLTQPDWSPDGTMLAAISCEHMPSDQWFTCGELVLVPIEEDGTLGEVIPLYTPDGDMDSRENVFYPAWSPDGKWIAFNKAYGISYDNPDAALYVISADGGDPIYMANADLGASLENSWPHWGPLPDDDVYWLTFSSVRNYGDLVTDGRNQIWVAAFRPELAEAGEDPSSPAFWLPNQDMETSNHTTFWGP